MRGLHFALCLAAGSLPLSLYAAPVQQPHLIRDGQGFACSGIPPEGPAKYAVCGRLGPLSLGMDRTAAEKILGAPTTSKSFGNNAFYIYSLQVDEAAHMVTYAAVGYDSAHRISSIQLTGLPWSGAWTFNDIKLGDTGKTVIARLGEPHGVSPGSATDTLIWDYLPWTFSFEVRGTLVSSIRVSE